MSVNEYPIIRHKILTILGCTFGTGKSSCNNNYTLLQCKFYIKIIMSRKICAVDWN